MYTESIGTPAAFAGDHVSGRRVGAAILLAVRQDQDTRRVGVASLVDGGSHPVVEGGA